MSKYDHKEFISSKIKDITRILSSLEENKPMVFKVSSFSEGKEKPFTFHLEGNMCQTIKNEMIKNLELRLKELEVSYFQSKDD